MDFIDRFLDGLELLLGVMFAVALVAALFWAERDSIIDAIRFVLSASQERKDPHPDEEHHDHHR